MKRAFVLSVSAAATILACNALLGIDADVIDPVATGGGGDASIDGTARPRIEFEFPDGLPTQAAQGTLAATIKVKVTRNDDSASGPINVYLRQESADIPANTVRQLGNLSIESGAEGTLTFSVARLAPRGVTVRTVLEAEGTTQALPLEITGAIDTTFGSGGLARLDIGVPAELETTGVGLHVDDKGITVAFATQNATGPNILLRHLDPNGTPDDQNGAVIDEKCLPRDLAFVGGNTFVVAGEEQARNQKKSYIRVVDYDRKADASLTNVGVKTITDAGTLVANGILVADSGTWVGGYAELDDGGATGFVYQYTAKIDGGSFAETPVRPGAFEVTDVLEGANNGLRLVGTDRKTQRAVVRDFLPEDGGGALRQAAAGTAAFNAVRADPYLLIAGSEKVGAGKRPRVIVAPATGALETRTFVTDDQAVMGELRDGVRLSDGAFLFVGMLTVKDDLGGVVKLKGPLPDLELDKTFGASGLVSVGEVGRPTRFRRIAMQGENAIVAGVEQLGTTLNVVLVRIIP